MFGRYPWNENGFEMQPQSNLNLFKTCVKDHEESFSRLLYRKKDLISMYRGALVGGLNL